MTQEEKARAYDEALERARKQKYDYQKELDKTDKRSQLVGLLRAGISAIDMVFPQLTESEDENLKNKSGYYKAGKFWKASTLWNAIKDKTPLRVPNRYILQECTWNIGTLQRFADEVKNVYEVDLNYPIILDMNGNILDGAHRVVKAYLEGKDIDIVYLGDDEWPEPDYNEEKAVKESKDERMIREIKRYIKEQGDKPSGLPNGTVAVFDMIDWLEKQKENIEKEYVFRPLAGTDITIAAEQAIRRANEGDHLVLAFNGVYLPVRKYNSAKELVDEYDAYLEKQKEEEGYEAIPVESTLEYKLGFKAGKESEKQKEIVIQWFKSDNVKNPDKPYIDKTGMFYTTDGRMCYASEIEKQKEQKYYWKPTETDAALFNKAVTTNKALTPAERAQLDIIRSKFGYCRAVNCSGIVQKEQSKEKLVYRLNGLMQDYIKEGKDEEEKEHRLKCYQLFWDALEDTSYFEQKEQKPASNNTLEEDIKLYYDTYGNGKGGFDYMSYPKFKDIVETFVSEHGKEQDFPYGVNETVDKLIAIAECLEMDGDCLFNEYTGTECGKFLRDLARKQVEGKSEKWSQQDERKLQKCIEVIERWERDLDINYAPYSSMLKSLHLN